MDTSNDLVGLVACRKCSKTFSHPHKCIPMEYEKEELKEMVIGLSLLANNQRKELEALGKVMIKIRYFLKHPVMKAKEEAQWSIERYDNKDWDLL